MVEYKNKNYRSRQDVKIIHVEIDVEINARIRRISKMFDKTLRCIVEDALSEYIERHKKDFAKKLKEEQVMFIDEVSNPVIQQSAPVRPIGNVLDLQTDKQ